MATKKRLELAAETRRRYLASKRQRVQQADLAERVRLHDGIEAARRRQERADQERADFEQGPAAADRAWSRYNAEQAKVYDHRTAFSPGHDLIDYTDAGSWVNPLTGAVDWGMEHYRR